MLGAQKQKHKKQPFSDACASHLSHRQKLFFMFLFFVPIHVHNLSPGIYPLTPIKSYLHLSLKTGDNGF